MPAPVYISSTLTQLEVLLLSATSVYQSVYADGSGPFDIITAASVPSTKWVLDYISFQSQLGGSITIDGGSGVFLTLTLTAGKLEFISAPAGSPGLWVAASTNKALVCGPALTGNIQIFARYRQV